MTTTLSTNAAIGAALMSGKLTRIMCADLLVGDVVQDEVTGEIYPVIKVNKSSYVIDGRTACDCAEVLAEMGETFDADSEEFGHGSSCRETPDPDGYLHVRLSFRAGHYVMGIRAEDIVAGI